MAKTTTAPSGLSTEQSEALITYAGVADEFKRAEAELVEAEKSIEPAREALESVRTKVQSAVDAMGGVDPFSLLKSSRAGRKTGPRDPAKRQSVIDAMTGATVAEISKASGQDKGYVNGVINSLKTKGEVNWSGERGSFSYTYSPKA